MNPSSPVPAPSRLPSLDGIRAVAILMVIGWHAEGTGGYPVAYQSTLKYFFDGGLGVRAFFVLSGFLITHLLLAEEAGSRRVSLRNFYIRRALRLLPVYFAFLLVLFVLTRTTPIRLSAAEWLADLTFTRDFLFHQQIDSHLWSLAVEEQFYLAWPLIFSRCGYRGRWWTSVVTLGAAPFFRTMFYALDWGNYSQFSFPSNMDSLMTGCVAALLMARHGATMRARLEAHPGWHRAGALAAIWAVVAAQRSHAFGKLTVPFGSTVQNLGLALLLLSLAHVHRGLLYRLLNLRFVVWIGVLSYSLYIWHELFVAGPDAYGHGSIPWLKFPYVLGSIFVAAVLSYYGLETPFMRWRRWFRARPRPVAPAA